MRSANETTDASYLPPEAIGIDPVGTGPRLRLRDIRAIFRLIGEINDLGADPQQWRPHMVLRLRQLIGATIVVSSEVHFRRTPPRVGSMRVIDIGWICDSDGHVTHVHTEREDERPEAFWLTVGGSNESGSDKKAGASASDEDGDELVPVKPSTKVYGGTSFIMSQVALPHAGGVDQLGLHREWGDAPFTHAQHRLVRIFHLELARLWRRNVLREAKEPTSDLPPRLLQTLDALLTGSSEKEIAQKLDLSRHTIHNYVKALHQRFQVSSRGELLAKAGQIRADAGPRLSMSLPRKTAAKPGVS